MALPETTKEQLISAIRRFDQELRGRKDWLGWEGKRNFQYAIVYEGALYPPKEIISLATSQATSTFNGGVQSNNYLRKYGFEVKQLRTNEPEVATEAGLSDALAGILAEYSQARKSGPVSKANPVMTYFRGAQEWLRNSASVQARPSIEVAYSTGKGNWAAVPWISLLDKTETTTTQQGRYVVFLFRADCAGVYLTLNQGVTQPTEELGRRAGLEALRQRAADMRQVVVELAEREFLLNEEIKLSPGGLGSDYEASTVAHKYYPAGAIPSDAELEADIEAVLQAYERVLKGPNPDVTQKRAWIFQANPKIFNVEMAIRALHELAFSVSRYAAEIQVGDTVYLWESGRAAGIVAVGEVIAPVVPREDDPASRPFWKKPELLEGTKPRTVLRIVRVLDPKLSKERLSKDLRLKNLTFLKAPMGTNFPLTEVHRQAIEALLMPPRGLRPDELCAAFSAALRNSGLFFGKQHEQLVRSFLSSVLAKPFVILTGLSGSGKTQLALKLGEWLGESRHRVIPVRPDWTGPESLLGYEDALLPVAGGRRAWCAPDALQLMLSAVADPAHPYLLVLDEMNLAHVERYFADVLSGVESRKAILPNLRQDAKGFWRVPPGEDVKRPMPRNLFIVGTVNVDETTYMFSPKVLDRANTIEFRVATDALPEDPIAVTRPRQCESAPEEALTSMLRIVTDDSWQTSNAHLSLKTFASGVRQIHEGLSHHGYEFGHRTYYEALRLAALLTACGVESIDESIDIFLLQKVLPRLHGARRKLEPVLRSLGAFAFDRRAMDSEAAKFEVLNNAERAVLSSAMPKTFEKICRMMRALQANQFASFSD